MAEGGRGGRPLPPKTVLRVLRVIRKAIGDAKREGILRRNVARLADQTVRVRQTLGVTNGVPRFSTPKSRRSRRVTDIDDRTAEIMRTHWMLHTDTELILGTGADPATRCDCAVGELPRHLGCRLSLPSMRI